MYSWSVECDFGDKHYFDTPCWKGVVAGLASFRDISLITIGGGSSSGLIGGLDHLPSPSATLLSSPIPLGGTLPSPSYLAMC
jgi:hypothetical protein